MTGFLLRSQEKGVLEGVFAKTYASLGCGALSARCTAGPNTSGYFFVSLAAAPFAKTPFSWFLTYAFFTARLGHLPLQYISRFPSSGASGGSLHGGASFMVEKAHSAARKKGSGEPQE